MIISWKKQDTKGGGSLEDSINRQELIHQKGFNLVDNQSLEYGKIKVGAKTLDDAVLNLGAIK